MSGLYLAITRVDVSAYVAALAAVYSVLIIIRILLSWFPRIPYSRWSNAAIEFVTEVTDPYLNLFRRFMPLVRVGPGALDLSPMIALVVLGFASSIVVNLIHG